MWSRWNTNEVEKLKRLYPILSCHEVAEMLSRPEGSTRVKAMKLGVKKKFWGGPKPKIALEDMKTIAFSLAYEGTIRIAKRKCLYARQKFHLSPEVALFNTDYELIQAFRDLVGCGHIYKKKTRQRKNHRLSYVWTTRRSSDIIAIMEAVLPFAPSTKFRRKCELILSYCRSRVNRPRYRSPYTDAEIKLYKESKKLNKKGAEIA